VTPIVVTGAIMAAVIALGAAWFVYRTITDSKHRTTLPPTVAAHHPLPTVVDLGPDTATWPAPRHTHRDPTTGRYTRRDKL
jgi:hypothetical protein